MRQPVRTATACVLTLLAALFVGFSSVKVSQDYDNSVDFSVYRTYGWIPGPQQKTGDIRVDNPLLDARIRNAVDRNLAAKEYRQDKQGKPDMLVAYHLAIRSRIESEAVGTGAGYWGYPYWGGVGYETRVREYDEGMLVIDIADATTNRLIWRGVGTRRVTGQTSPEKTTEMVNKTVAEILAQFPPVNDVKNPAKSN